jgi:hypothetical protein
MGALCLRRRRLRSRYAAQWMCDVEGRRNPSGNRKRRRGNAFAKGDCRSARSHRNAALKRRCRAGTWRLALLGGRFVVGAVVVRDCRGIRSGRTAARMIVTRRVGRSYREVEGANSGHDSHKTTHGGLILIGKTLNCSCVALSLVASSSPIGSKLGPRNEWRKELT